MFKCTTSIKVEFSDFKVGKGYSQILAIEELPKDHNVSKNYSHGLLNENTEKELFNHLKNSPFFEDLIIEHGSIKDFYKDF